MRRTDNRTVKALELRAPGSSSDDVKVLRRLLENGTLFSTVDLEKREAIWKRLLSLEGILIPSLYTFFEDLKFLRVPEKIMKSLIEPPFKGSLYEMMEQHFTGANQSSHEIHFQDPETTFKLSPAQLIECGYQQLLLYPQRNFRKMIGECPRKEKDRPKPIIMEPDPVAWHKYASLASRLGFDSPAIRRLMADDPYKKYARASLQKSCLSESYTFDEVAFESCVEKIASTLATATKKSPHPVTPALVTDGVGEDLPRRCGRFFETAYDQDRELLFLETLNSTFQNQRGKSITSFFVRRCVYFAFFGEQFTQAGFNTTATPEPAPVAPAASNDRTSSHPITGALVVEGVQEQQSSTTTTGDQEVSAHMQPSSSRDLVVVEQVWILSLYTKRAKTWDRAPRMRRLKAFIRHLAGFSSEYIKMVASKTRTRRFLMTLTRSSGSLSSTSGKASPYGMLQGLVGSLQIIVLTLLLQMGHALLS